MYKWIILSMAVWQFICIVWSAGPGSVNDGNAGLMLALGFALGLGISLVTAVAGFCFYTTAAAGVSCGLRLGSEVGVAADSVGMAVDAVGIAFEPFTYMS